LCTPVIEYQTAQGILGFYDQTVPNLVLKIVVVMHLAHRAFEAFAHPIFDLTLFVELRIFMRVVRS
jgi:hypothetical protein